MNPVSTPLVFQFFILLKVLQNRFPLSFSHFLKLITAYPDSYEQLAQQFNRPHSSASECAKQFFPIFLFIFYKNHIFEMDYFVRKPWIGGNWKSNGSVAANQERVTTLNSIPHEDPPVDVVVFPTFVHIPKVIEQLTVPIEVGAQNCSRTNEGAFTGEISAKMLKEMGVKWILCGHSERRQLFYENDECIAEKVEKVLDCNIVAVICIGETLEERNAGKSIEVCMRQLNAVILKITDWSKIVIAYEPIWAIGTGVVASPEVAEQVHQEIRAFLQTQVSNEVAQKTRLVYGGSVNAANCEDLILKPNIDGFLVGGASLKPEFNSIVTKVRNSMEK
ncbi:triose-phosphate isomerase TPI-II [Cardiosporidium cionae]|uniref:Triosephosphate isomerase n=1 Tax=Cardiosporidium cionae TaxID=476202 RepID=A0A3Q8UBJ1_9APIC|nr:triosephosphate isomerase [Cardiosporidium cionae]AZL94292.1 triosephosphate isomerase [Cardiosporidium cionae]KAF8821158.1 triose-phosphate isomerase TPI-II [Cardiosporidium cionae]|eukprot:KAF8821158.1 triose-phosphate isomerase TPI-II [Cardiosporidium cionae]